MEGNQKFPPKGSGPISAKLSIKAENSHPRRSALNDDEAQIDPRGLAPSPERKNSKSQRSKTSLIFVLFEFALAEGRLELQFPEQCTSIFKLDKFANASFHSGYRKSVEVWRNKLSENRVLKDRLLKQHRIELEKLTYPLPKRRGKQPIRKRGYRDKGSTDHFTSEDGPIEKR
jgi:hypothetical protein